MVKSKCNEKFISAITCLISISCLFLLSLKPIAISEDNNPPLLTPQNSHSIIITDLKCSPNGKYLISTSKDGSASLWDTTTYNKLAIVGADIFGTSFSPSGDTINLCRSNYLSQFSINNLKVTDKRKLATAAISTVNLLNDGNIIWSGDQKSFLTSAEQLPQMVYDASFYEPLHLAAYSFKGEIEIWDYLKNTIIQTLFLPEYEYIQTKFNSNGTQLAIFTDDFSTCIFYGDNFSQKKLLQKGTEKKIKPLTNFEFFRIITPINRLAFAANGNVITLNNDKNDIYLSSYSPNADVEYNIPLNIKKIPGKYFCTPCVTIAPNGKFVAIWQYDNYKISIYNAITGVKNTEITISDAVKTSELNKACAVTFSPDSSTIYIGDINGNIAHWDINGNYLSGFGQKIAGIFALRYTADDTLTAVTDNLDILRWDIVTGRAVSQPGIEKKFQYPVEILPDGSVAQINDSIRISSLATGKNAEYNLKGWKYNHRYSLFDTVPGQVAAVLRNETNNINVAVAALNIADGKLLINLLKDRFQSAVTVNAKQCKALMTNSGKPGVSIVDMQTGFAYPTDIPGCKTAEITDTGEILFADNSVNPIHTGNSNTNTSITTFGLATPNGKIIWKKSANDINIPTRIIYNNLYFAICDSLSKKINIFNMADGTPVIKLPCEELKPTAFSPDNLYLLSADTNNTMAVYQLPEGKLVSKFNLVSQPTVTTFSPDGNYAAIGCSNGAIEIYRRFDWTRQALVMITTGGEWSVADNTGRYDTSNGIGKGLRWTIAHESIELSQLKERYYDPGLLSKAMDRNFEPKRDVEALENVKLFPDMKIDYPTDGTKLSVNLDNRGGGIGDIIVMVNGRAMPMDARGGKDKNSKSLKILVDVAQSPVFIPGIDNLIEIAVKNADDTLTSNTVAQIWRAPGIKKDNTPHLFALVCGISEYSGGMKLKFAANDAISIANVINVAGKKLLGQDQVKVISLNSDDINNMPTRTNIIKALDYFKENAGTDDIIIVYLSGHGIALDENNYCYLTSDAKSVDVIRDKKLRDKYSVSSSDLQLLMGRIPALKQLLILDTCAAGSAARNLIDKRDITGDHKRAIERLRDRAGFHILMGCSADAKSFEASRYGHGLLTYALLEGFKGVALREGKYIDTSKLFNYAADRVPQLARGVGGIQKPIIAVPHGSSFDFGMLDTEDQMNIKIIQPLTIFTKPVLLDTQKTRDTLNISYLLQNALRNKDDKIIYIDTESLPDSMNINGIYTITGEQITAKIKIWKNDKVVNEFSLQSKNAADLVKQITDKL